MTPIAIVDRFDRFPAPLSIGAYADYLTAADLDDHWIHIELEQTDPNHAKAARRALDNLLQQYPIETTMPLRSGDPRAFLFGMESRVAYLNGQVGIHCEAFLMNEPASREIQQRWCEHLSVLAGIFNHSIVFVSSTGIVSERTGTVTINTFTPLANGSVAGHKIAPKTRCLMLSPYLDEAVEPNLEHCPTLDALHDTLELIAKGWKPMDAVTHAKNRARVRLPLSGNPLFTPQAA